MDWKTKIVLPPNYVSLRHLKELREKEKAELELKIREEAEAEYRFRLEEEERLRKLKEDEEERLKKLKDDEEKRQKEEEEKMKREREEEDRLRRDQILRTRTLLCGEPSRTRRNGFKKYAAADDDDGVNQVIGDRQEEEIKKEIVAEVAEIKDEHLEKEGKKKNRRWGKGKKKYPDDDDDQVIGDKQEQEIVAESKEDENLEEGKKKKKKWGKKKKKKDYEKETLELESQTLESETKSIEIEKENTKPSGSRTRRQRNFEAKGIADKKIEMNQKVVEGEIERKIGDLNVNSVDEEKLIPPDTKPSGFKTRRQRKLEVGDKKFEMNQKVEEEIEKRIGDVNVNNRKMKSKAEKQTGVKDGDKFRIQNIQKHGRYVNNPRNASCSSYVWLPKEM